ncbi:hypothetical protein F-S17_0151 [Faustovirus]|nr:hypothetical protein F-S17_0151 [Faustovirus]
MAGFDDLPNEIVTIILDDATDDHDELIVALELTCRRFYGIAREFRFCRQYDLIGYYLTCDSPAGVAFALSLRYTFVCNQHVGKLIKTPTETVDSVFTDVFSTHTYAAKRGILCRFVVACLQKGRRGHLMMALKHGYAPDTHIITVAMDAGAADMLVTLLERMTNIGDRLRAIEATIMQSFARMSLFKMLDMGMRLKHIMLDPRYVSMVIYSIYKHSPGNQEPEFIIRWILDNLQFRPIFIPIRESFTRVNNMLRLHHFKFLQTSVEDVTRLFVGWI